MRARLAALLLALPGVATAQGAQAPARGAASITPADVQRRIRSPAMPSSPTTSAWNVAIAPGRPKWNPESYKQVVTGAGGVP
jgi:hypothetical protein